MKTKKDIYSEMQNHLDNQDVVDSLTIGMNCSERDLRERVIQDEAIVSKYKKRTAVWNWILGETNAITV